MGKHRSNSLRAGALALACALGAGPAWSAVDEAAPTPSPEPVAAEAAARQASPADASATPAPAAGPPAASPPTVETLIDAAAAVHGLPAAFLKRLIWVESRFDPAAVSPKGAQGIAQFMPATAAERGLADPFDPAKAIPESAALIAEHRARFGNLGLAAAAYNAGAGRVGRWLAGTGGLPLETRRYVRSITGQAAEDWRAPAEGADAEPAVPPTPAAAVAAAAVAAVKAAVATVAVATATARAPAPPAPPVAARRQAARTPVRPAVAGPQPGAAGRERIAVLLAAHRRVLGDSVAALQFKRPSRRPLGTQIAQAR